MKHYLMKEINNMNRRWIEAFREVGETDIEPLNKILEFMNSFELISDLSVYEIQEHTHLSDKTIYDILSILIKRGIIDFVIPDCPLCQNNLISNTNEPTWTRMLSLGKIIECVSCGCEVNGKNLNTIHILEKSHHIVKQHTQPISSIAVRSEVAQPIITLRDYFAGKVIDFCLNHFPDYRGLKDSIIDGKRLEEACELSFEIADIMVQWSEWSSKYKSANRPCQDIKGNK